MQHTALPKIINDDDYIHNHMSTHQNNSFIESFEASHNQPSSINSQIRKKFLQHIRYILYSEE